METRTRRRGWSGSPTGRAAAAACCLLAGCAPRPPGKEVPAEERWASVDAAALEGSQRIQYERAVAARDALAGELMGALSQELAESGPAAAIAVCRSQAPAYASAVSERLGVRIGRTSWQLRNPANTAPAWAAPLLAERPAEPRAAADPAGRLGVALPIRLAGQCLTCHGPEESIPGDVRAALAALYPTDAATGFREGDLRGWFWIEVPPLPR